ncbi:tRNA (5-methylaminomethyl-2-thiouridine)(34)-methyltransferase MnmD [Candidatus Laterigemmans baculatus]|uniref:tRNA (5-methylaminomethyl-2-thiouridine)(34)-methyltransferase MnmD n=1 Tax=Candidatus Laterigemmans baculatus TaxID=2770505 RepID=UPI0013DBFA9A|nr:tRNA (5-methylaminomethyl-2-thiouridine)(34)-methyltransferase MnmD [Candidatus Laterigemmans baculatus]
MPIPERPQFPTSDPRFRLLKTDDGSWTLLEVANGDTFHSGCGAAAECRHVYLENSGSGMRLRRAQPTSVLEVGFGTGLAFVLTAAEAVRAGTPLDYVALEQRLLPVDVLAAALAASPVTPDEEFEAVRESLLSQLAALPPLSTTGRVGESGGQVPVELQIAANCRLRLVIGDAAHWQPSGAERYDAIYFDPFSPASSPELWEPEVLRRMRGVLAREGRLVSYCVNSLVRSRLEAVGFQVRRVPGPVGGKREVLIAEGANYSAN